MPRRPTTRRTLVLVVVAATLVGLGTAAVLRRRPAPAVDQVTTYPATPPSEAAGRPRRAPYRLSVAVLGDSVPAGSACGCSGFGDVFGGRVAATTHAAVTVNNLGTPRQTSAGLAASLGGNRLAARVLAGADIVTITIGANDFSFGDYSGKDCPHLSCYAGGLRRMRAAVDAALVRIAVLRAGRPTAVRVTGYWDIWQDGAVARAVGESYSRVGDALTQKVNAELAASAAAHRATFVDLFTAFRGSGGHDDDTSLLAADGDHPNRVGHGLIADALAGAGLAPLL